MKTASTNNLKSLLMICYCLLIEIGITVAQNPLTDSTVDYSFGTVKLSELLKFKKAADYGNTTNLKSAFNKNGFTKIDTGFVSFYNDSLGQTLEYHGSAAEFTDLRNTEITANKSILILKSTRTQWKNTLKEFIQQQKWNEEITVTEHDGKEFEVSFSNLFKELQLFITLYNGDYCLVLM